MGFYAHTIPDFKDAVIGVLAEELFQPSALRDQLRSTVADIVRELGLTTAAPAPTATFPAVPVEPGVTVPGSPPTTVTDPSGLTTEQQDTLTSNTGDQSGPSGPAPTRYDPQTGAPVYDNPAPTGQ